MTATHPYPTQTHSSIPSPTAVVPPLAPHFPKMFWIAPNGKTISADEAEVQALVDAGRLDFDIMSHDPGSVWTKPASLGFVAKPPSSVSADPPATAPVMPPPAPPKDWPSPTTTIPKATSPTMSPLSMLYLPEPVNVAATTRRIDAPVPVTSESPTQPFVFLHFATAIVGGVLAGAKFQLADGRTMDSPIPEADVPVTADIVRQALAQVEKEYKRRGQAPESMKVVEIQEAVVVLAAFLNYQAKLTGGPVSRHLIQFGTAVADFQHTLHVVINSED